MYSDTTFSEKAAAVMMIGSVTMLIPAIPGLFMAGVMFIGTLISMNPAIIVTTIPFLIAGIGITMLIGYTKLYRRQLSRTQETALWIGTLIFNAVPLAPALFYMNEIVRETPIVTPIVLWWSFAVLASAAALTDNFYVQKNR